MTLYQNLFDMTETLCRRYPALTPFSVRKERAREVFLLIRRVCTQPKTEAAQQHDAQGRERRPAGDNWF
jgi:hypothetical protein